MNAKKTQEETNRRKGNTMLWKDLLLTKFENGFRILKDKDPDDKFFVIDEVDIKIGDEYRVGPNGYFELIKSVEAGVAYENNT